MLKELVRKTRSYRRFVQEEPVSEQTLREMVDLARLTGSVSNKQPLKYMLSWQPEKNALIFPNLGWAGYLEDWPGPAEGERPAAYIIILCDREITDDPSVDPGIAAQTIMLGLAERGLGGCIIGSVKRIPLRRSLAIPDRYKILYVIAIGKPAEQVVLETVGRDGDTRYWRDEQSVHHVPKRTLEEVIIG